MNFKWVAKYTTRVIVTLDDIQHIKYHTGHKTIIWISARFA
jgi:hypothetical protein